MEDIFLSEKNIRENQFDGSGESGRLKAEVSFFDFCNQSARKSLAEENGCSLGCREKYPSASSREYSICNDKDIKKAESS